MSDAFALDPNSGRMSGAALKRAQERIRRELFGDGLEHPHCTQPSARETQLHQAAEYRALAARGMKPRAYIKQAEALEREAAQL